MVSKRTLFFVFLLTTIMLACTKDIPHLTEGQMEDILYDYHLAQAMAAVDNNVQDSVYLRSMLKKHEVTQEEFDSSMIYYLRHTEEIQKIYKNVTERLNETALSVGGLEGISTNVEYSENGDTANIWRMNRFAYLTNYQPYTKLNFTLKADTSFHASDMFAWYMDAQFMYQDGYRNATAVLYIRYANDSIQSEQRNFSTDGRKSFIITSDPELKIKTVSGFVILGRSENESRTTMKMLFLSNIRLLKLHVKPDTAIGKDTENSENPPSSLPQKAPSSEPVELKIEEVQ